MSRNVLNTWDVDAFLAGFVDPRDDPEIWNWLDRIARRWILKEFPAAGMILRACHDAKEEAGWVDVRWAEGADSTGVTRRRSTITAWLEDALPNGVYWLDMDGPTARDLAVRLNAVVAYFDGLSGSPRFNRLARVSLPDAVAAAFRFRDMVRAREAARRDNVLMEFGDGYRVVLVTSAKDLRTEGDRMRHCVGNYVTDLNYGVDILSLRDPRGRPHVTMEVAGGRTLKQIKGKANGPVAPRYRSYVAALIQELALVLAGDRGNLGITHRPFDRDAPDGWPAQSELTTLVRADIAGDLDRNDTLECFYEDASAVIDALPEAAWTWFVNLFRGPAGRFVWLRPDRAYEVGSARFATVDVMFPGRLYEIVGGGRGDRCRALKRALRNELGTVVVEFCRCDSSALLDLLGCETLLDIDVRRLRHEHQQRVRCRLAATRHDVRRRRAAPRPSYAKIARWEAERRAFARCLHDYAGDYL